MPFLKNVWYAAGHAEELDEGMLSRKICNEQIVLFRTSDGQIAALQDRCPHRFVPLSMGKRVGDTLQCGYHGLKFDALGACAEAPNDDPAQAERICVRAYTAVERHAVIWLWMGEKDLADPALIPDFSFLASERFAVGRGVSHFKANYLLLADNLLDLSHVHYLHPGVHVGSKFSDFTNEVKIEGEAVWSMLWRHHYAVGSGQREMHGWNSDDVEGQGHVRWNAPGVLLVHTALWEHGKTIEQGVETPSAHLLTPETEYSCHYIWAAGRTYDLDNEAMTRSTAQMVKTVFETQDGPMCEAQQIAMGESTDFLQMQPIILRADAAGVAARRLMKRKLRDEAEAAGQSALAAE